MLNIWKHINWQWHYTPSKDIEKYLRLNVLIWCVDNWLVEKPGKTRRTITQAVVPSFLFLLCHSTAPISILQYHFNSKAAFQENAMSIPLAWRWLFPFFNMTPSLVLIFFSKFSPLFLGCQLPSRCHPTATLPVSPSFD